jgi:hypothetical protein
MSTIDTLDDAPFDAEAILGLLTTDEKADKYKHALESAIEAQERLVEAGRYEQHEHLGFEPGDCSPHHWVPSMLAGYGLVEQTYKSNSATYYRLGRSDGDEWTYYTDEAETLLELAQEPEEATTDGAGDPRKPLSEVDVDTLFNDVVGYSQVKTYLRRTLDKQAPIHHLLVGQPGSGKSMMLDSIYDNVAGATRTVLAGNQTSAQGIVDLLKAEQPPVLIVEEIEKGSKADREALMTLCGNGYIQETKADGRAGRRIELDTIVFAAGNDMDAITPPSLIDRFVPWRFEPYSREDFVTVCQVVLPRETEVDADMARVIAHTLHDEGGSTSVRVAEKVAMLVEDEDEVAELVPLMM